ncbi:MAG: hypothetical protein AAFY59_03195, partial [Pseudomonadota bacterium]
MPATLIASSATTVDLNTAFSEWRLPEGATLTGTPGLTMSAEQISLFVDGTITSDDDTIRIADTASDAFVYISASATLTAQSTSVADGVEMFLGTDFATIINDGTIDAADSGIEANGDGGTVFNNGTAHGGNQGLQLAGAGNTVVNTGLVTGRFGVEVFIGGTGGHVIQNTGIIRGTNEGIVVNGDNSSPITLINNGNISATNGPRAIEGDVAEHRAAVEDVLHAVRAL